MEKTVLWCLKQSKHPITALNTTKQSKGYIRVMEKTVLTVSNRAGGRGLGCLKTI